MWCKKFLCGVKDECEKNFHFTLIQKIVTLFTPRVTSVKSNIFCDLAFNDMKFYSVFCAVYMGTIPHVFLPHKLVF